MKIFLFILVFLHSTFANTQLPFEFSRLGVNEGLSQNSVYAIHQDEQGFMWFGTGDGLNRYNGKTFKIYREKWNDTSSRNLPGRIIISKILQDNQQRLWFTTNNGLAVMDKKTERFYPASVFNTSIKQWEKEAVPLAKDAEHKLWFLYREIDFIVLNPVTWEFEKVSIPGLLSNKNAIINSNELYFITAQGFSSYDLKTRSVKQLKTVKNIASISRIGPNKLALHSPEQTWVFNIAAATFDEFSLPVIRNKNVFLQSAMIYEFPENVFYIRLVFNGLLRYNRKTDEQNLFQHEPANSSSLSNNYITTSYVDRSNNLWLGTEGGGLSRIDLKPPKFKSFPSFYINAGQAANLMVKCISTAAGKILIGTFEEGLYLVDSTGDNFQKQNFSGLFPAAATHPPINVLQHDKAGRLWMNTGNAIGYLDTVTFRYKEVVFLKAPPKIPLAHSWIYSMVEYEPNKYLLGTFHGLYRMQIVNNKIETWFQPQDSVLNGHISSLERAPDGTIYVGMIRNGFRQIKINNSKIEIIDKGFLTTGIRHFYFDRKLPVVWMASESGLIAYNRKTKKATVYDGSNGLSNSYIYSILPENDSTLWMSTNNGINRAIVHYSKDHVLKISATDYTQVDGLQSNEFNTGAFYRSPNGNLFFGGVNGINWFKGSAMISNRYPSQVALTSLMINEEEYQSETATPYLKKIELPYHQNTISLKFASLEFTNAPANLYAYKLEGFDKDWIYSGTINEARYANLPPGNYFFKMRGTNNDRIWNEMPQEIEIIITPPFWQTIWFKALAALVLLGVVVLGIHFYISARIKSKMKELEKQKAVNDERLRISRDMHDELGTGLTKIALLTEVTKQKLGASERDFVPLQEIASTSRKLTEKMGEIIWTLNPANDTLDNLAVYLKEQLFELTDGTQIELTTSFPEEIPPIRMSNLQRQQILLVTKEGVNNILKHSAATAVEFSLQINSSIVFMLKDNGCGFETVPVIDSSNGKRNGLNNMAWRMEQIGGNFSVMNKKEGGTILVYDIPRE